MDLFQYRRALCFSLLVLETTFAGSQSVGRICPGFVASWDQWSHNYGLFLLSNSSVFGFGFYTAADATFLLVVIHISSAKVVWAVDKDSSGAQSEKFVFDKYGNAYLQNENGVAWSTNTSGQKVTSMELRDSGNLVLHGEGEVILWQSFDHPTNTLLSGQEFHEGMTLTSYPKSNKIKTLLEFKSGDLLLYAGFQTPQTYWSLANDSRKNNYSISGKVHSASLVANEWNFYDQNKTLLWQFRFSKNTDETATWAVILGSDGAVTFSNLQKGNLATSEAFKIPENICGIPEPCDRYRVCTFDNLCECPTSLDSRFKCEPPITLTCNISKDSAELFYVGSNLDYFALGFVKPFPRYNLDACKEACLHDCSCSVLFFENRTQNCFLFDQIGSLKHSQQNSTGYVSYVKIPRGNGHKIRNGGKKTLLIVIVVVANILVMAGSFYVGNWYHKKKRSLKFSSQGNLEEDTFLNRFSGMPVRFSYNDLTKATKGFSTKVGQGGFGSVYLGVLPDGTQLAVKKLESIGQGKEFTAEVSTIGKVHHLHLVKLRGFCTEGSHRLLVYDYMRNGSLNKWIFKADEESQLLSWNIRFNIALGTAKGLAYLHSECEVKIVHCDIKPENVLLDDKFNAKVSDFGMAKLMNHEESLAYTTLRGTRGYLAPEWIKNSPISEKSDVYSYGIVLLEIIGGRRSYDLDPSYVFKMLEEGNLREIIDPKLDINEIDEIAVTAIKVALWCIQEEMHLRPPMTKVVQMLEGQCVVPQPPRPSQKSSMAYSDFIMRNSEVTTSIELQSGGILSDVQLSGPR